jgi:hypothetical protein
MASAKHRNISMLTNSSAPNKTVSFAGRYMYRYIGKIDYKPGNKWHILQGQYLHSEHTPREGTNTPNSAPRNGEIMSSILFLCARSRLTWYYQILLDVVRQHSCDETLSDDRILPLLKLGRPGGLEVVSLSGCRHITDSTLFAVADFCPSLRELDLRWFIPRHST